MTTATVGVVPCGTCGQKNRVPATAPGTPRCGNCHAPLPWVTEAGDDDFDQVVEASSLPVVVDLWAPWCGPCRRISPALDQIAHELAGTLKLVKVNVDENPKISERFGVRSIPTLLVMHATRVLASQVGAIPVPALRRWIDDALAHQSRGG